MLVFLVSLPLRKEGEEEGGGGGRLSEENTYFTYWPWGGRLFKEILYTI